MLILGYQTSSKLQSRQPGVNADRWLRCKHKSDKVQASSIYYLRGKRGADMADMKVRIFRQRVSQVHEAETEINEWLAETGGSIEIQRIVQSAYMTDNTDNGQPGFIISVWYTD